MVRTLKPVQEIPHKDDKEIGFVSLRRCIRNYVIAHKDELKALEIDLDDFQQDVFFNMIRRNGYPQYNSKKNKGSFQSYVSCNCSRYQIDLSRQRDTKRKNIARMLHPEWSSETIETAFKKIKNNFTLSLNTPVMHKKGGDTHTELLDIIYGGGIDISQLETQYVLNELPTKIISLTIPISLQKMAKLFIEGYTSKELAKKFTIEEEELETYKEKIGHYVNNYYCSN